MMDSSCNDTSNGLLQELSESAEQAQEKEESREDREEVEAVGESLINFLHPVMMPQRLDQPAPQAEDEAEASDPWAVNQSQAGPNLSTSGSGSGSGPSPAVPSTPNNTPFGRWQNKDTSTSPSQQFCACCSAAHSSTFRCLSVHPCLVSRISPQISINHTMTATWHNHLQSHQCFALLPVPKELPILKHLACFLWCCLSVSG